MGSDGTHSTRQLAHSLEFNRQNLKRFQLSPTRKENTNSSQNHANSGRIPQMSVSKSDPASDSNSRSKHTYKDSSNPGLGQGWRMSIEITKDRKWIYYYKKGDLSFESERILGTEVLMEVEKNAKDVASWSGEHIVWKGSSETVRTADSKRSHTAGTQFGQDWAVNRTIAQDEKARRKMAYCYQKGDLAFQTFQDLNDHELVRAEKILLGRLIEMDDEPEGNSEVPKGGTVVGMEVNNMVKLE